ncbi:MAG: hypothetical protein ABI330_00215 [Caldimonas sp.]
MLRRALFLVAALTLALPVAAQVQRNFPQSALRGALVFAQAPEVTLNGQLARLAPGARIRDANNMTVVPGSLIGSRFLVHYTIDLYGLVKDVWILTPGEAANQPWPTTPEDAQAWTFDPVAQTWTKP